jgi:hypothetical protein
MSADVDRQLDDALLKLATGDVTVEEMGKDADGKIKMFKRKLPPNLDAIKYLKEQRKKSAAKKYEPSIIKRLTDDCES